MSNRTNQKRILFKIMLALVLLSGVIYVSQDRLPSAMSSSWEIIFSTFETDIANMVYEWDPKDPRSEGERQRALFDFMTENYKSSFWIPKSLLDGNVVTRAVAGSQKSIARDKVGLVMWPENSMTEVYGVSPNVGTGQPLGFTSNCVMCHLAEIDGQVYFGAGNKLFDEKVLVESLIQLTGYIGRATLTTGSSDRKLAKRVNNVITHRRHEKTDPLTRGRSTAYVGAYLEFYIRSHGGELPSVEELGRGDAKIPPLWHFAAKAPFDRWYVDGSFHGEIPMLASCMELFKDRSYEELDQVVIPAIKRGFMEVVSFIKPPKYPYYIDETLASKGKELFYSTEVGCFRCHGVYDGEGNVQWTGKHIDVGTDRGRIDVVSKGFIEALSGTPISKDGRLVKSEGYAATPLTGVWINYGYLHNGSVPTLYHLLGPESERPKIFNVMAARNFDPVRVGQKLYLDDKTAKLSESELLRKHGDDRDWFNANRSGAGNLGHDVWSVIKTDENRTALIEYLKTL